MRNRRILFSLLLLLSPLLSIKSLGDNDSTYTTPNRLFHISRSANKNLVCYDVNLENGQLATGHPIKVYWVNREERPGETNGLNYIQRKFAYGYKVLSTTSNSSICTLTAYPQRQLTVTQHNNKYVCLVKINNQTAILHSLYVKAHPHNPLKVEYVELEGISLSTHHPLRERVNN